jgi:hypothetical protein
MAPVSMKLGRLIESADLNLDTKLGEKCFEEFRWWYDFFLKADTDESNAPTFIRLLTGVPCDLVKEFKSAIAYCRSGEQEFSTNDPFENESSIEVFCDCDLLKNCLTQIIQNACRGKHSPETIPEIDWRFKIDEIDEHFIWLYARNTASDELTPSRGRGLITLNEKLEPFRSFLEGNPVDDSSVWTYQVGLRLLKWRHSK